MTADEIEGARVAALTAFISAREREGYLVETRTGTHAIITPGTLLSVTQAVSPFRKRTGRQVVEVDARCRVTMRRAEPLRS